MINMAVKGQRLAVIDQWSALICSADYVKLQLIFACDLSLGISKDSSLDMLLAGLASYSVVFFSLSITVFFFAPNFWSGFV